MDSEPMTTIAVDRGPTWEFCKVLIDRSTLGYHVAVTDRGSVIEISHKEGDPYSTWGDSTKGLWRLMTSVAHSDQEVGVRLVLNRLDHRNLSAVGLAFMALVGATV